MQNGVTSAGAQVVLAVIPIVGIVIGGIIIFFYLLWHHHEIKLQIRTGGYKPAKFDLKTFSLLVGLLLTGTGFVLTLFFLLMAGLGYALLGGVIPLVLGLCMLVFYKVNPDFRNTNAD
ncbi:hypothetical protein [Treponema parvum]|uniref:hypothetical protein n=1 Tax=Treponema parvum TaxID=138851 RepID=UPI001AEC2193|nr:hypothetical protein [Treponema parvum]QTQ15684.1 hypothetical protein HXT04_02620 [Treponema parvum]